MSCDGGTFKKKLGFFWRPVHGGLQKVWITQLQMILGFRMGFACRMVRPRPLRLPFDLLTRLILPLWPTFSRRHAFNHSTTVFESLGPLVVLEWSKDSLTTMFKVTGCNDRHKVWVVVVREQDGKTRRSIEQV